jgi:hypothetical protein
VRVQQHRGRECLEGPDRRSTPLQQGAGGLHQQGCGPAPGGEDELARKLGNAVPAYTVLPDSLLLDSSKAKAWVKQAGFDGAVVMRAVSVDQETTYVPGQAYVVPAGYGSMWGYWGPGWDYAYEPGYVKQDQVVSVEGNVYSVPDDKLVWASRTKTYNPESVRQLSTRLWT